MGTYGELANRCHPFVMNETKPQSVADTISDVYSRESRRVYATLVRILGSFELAEECFTRRS